jgi:transcriptional regulator with XRE-family HTH domain
MNDRLVVGTFIREQRLRAVPENFPDLRRRRRHVGHLSQSDVAELAGISVTVVGQVENGRYANLNPSLIRKLALALRLSPHQQQYVLNFIQQPSPHERREEYEAVPASVRSVVDASEPNPALIVNPRFDILYWNRSATGLLADFGKVSPAQRNVVVSMFGVPEMRVAWEDWESNARNIVAGLRMQASLHAAFRDAIHELADGMSHADASFATWWAEEEPLVRPHREKRFLHPRLGSMRLYQTVSEILGNPHLSLIVYTPMDEETARLFQEL